MDVVGSNGNSIVSTSSDSSSSSSSNNNSITTTTTTTAAAAGFEVYSFYANTAAAAAAAVQGTETISVAPSCGVNANGGVSLFRPPLPPLSSTLHSVGAQAHFTGIQPAAVVTHHHRSHHQPNQHRHYHHHHHRRLLNQQQQEQQQQQQMQQSAAVNRSVVRAIGTASSVSSSSVVAVSSSAQQASTVVATTSSFTTTTGVGKMVKEMPKLVKLAPNGSTDRTLLQQETKKRKKPIGKSKALVTSKPLTIVAPTPIITARNEDTVGSTKFTFTSQPPSNNPSLVLKKKDSTVQCSQTTTIKTGVSGSIPVGIAVARQRYTQSSSSSTEVQRQRETTTTTVSIPEVVHQPPMQTMVLSYNDCSMTTGTTAGINRWQSSGSCNIPQNTIGGQFCFQNSTLRAPALEQQSVQPVGYQLVQDQSGQFFLLPQNSITGLMTMPFDYCKAEASQNHQPNQGYTLIQQPPQQMATISPIINHHPQYTSIASSGSFLIQQVSSSAPPPLINTHHQLTDTSTHQQPLIQLASPENQMIIFNQQQSAIVAQPMIGHLQQSHPGLTIATQMQTGCQNQINDIQTVSESVTVQTKLVQQSITEKSTISSHTEENVSISLDYCNTTISEPEKDVKQEFCSHEQLLESEVTGAIVSHDASNQTDLQTEDEIYHSLTEERKETSFIESVHDCTDSGQPLTDGATQTMVLSIPENSVTPDITGLELLLNSIEQSEKGNSNERLNSMQQLDKAEHQEEVVVNKQETVDVPLNQINSFEKLEESGMGSIALLLLAERYLETKFGKTPEREHAVQSSSNYKLPKEVCEEEDIQDHQSTTESLKVTVNKGVAKKVYTNKSLANSGNITGTIKEPKSFYLKVKDYKDSNKYIGKKLLDSNMSLSGKVKEVGTDEPQSYLNLKNKYVDNKTSDSNLSSGKVKRGPGRPKKVLKEVDDSSNIGNNVKEKHLKLDCSSKINYKISSSSSSDLSPPVLEPWSPFSPRKDSKRTPPTLSPVPSVDKLSIGVNKYSNEKPYEKKITKKRPASFILPNEDEFKPPLKKRKVGRPRKHPIDEVVKKPQKKEKPVCSSSNSLSNLTTIEANKIEISSNSQYKIKPKLKAEVKIKHWDVDDEDDEIKDQDDVLPTLTFVSTKRPMFETVSNSQVICKKRKFSNVSLNSTDSLDDAVSFPQKEASYSSVPVRNQTSESSDVSLEQNNEEHDSSTTVELTGRQCTPVSPSRPTVDVTTANDDYERRRLKKKHKHRKHKHSHDESRIKHKHKHHKKHHKKHRRHRVSEPELSVSEPPTLSPQTPVDEEDDDKSKENDSSEVESSDVPSFLSDQQIWKWSGKSYKRPGRGGNKKTYYKAIVRGDETINVGDCAVFLSSGRPDRPYIGKVDCMWETNMDEKMQVKVFWFYHPEETIVDSNFGLPYPGGLFKSLHNDINDVQSIMNRCRVMSFEKFKRVVNKQPKRLKAIYDKNDLFYVAGNYEPVRQSISFHQSLKGAKTTITHTPMSFSTFH